MRENFDRAFDLTVMRFEGGARYTNDPDDPGGETKYGLSKRANPDLDILNMTKEQAKEIYLKRYWTFCDCDALPYPWDVITFDTAVNLGPKREIDIRDGATTPEDFHMRRIEYYANLATQKPNMQKFFRGWVNRVIQLWQETRQGVAP